MFDFAKKLLMARQFRMEAGHLELLAQRVIIVPAQLLLAISEKCVDDKVFEKEIYNVMKKAVSEFSAAAIQKFGLTRPKLLDLLFSVTELNGYGKNTLGKADYPNKLLRFSIKGLPSSLFPANKFINKKLDSYWAGISAGALTIVFNDPSIACLEIKCRSGQGKDECFFVGSTPKYLKENYPEEYKAFLGK